MEHALSQTCVKNCSSKTCIRTPSRRMEDNTNIETFLKSRERKDVEWVNLVQDKCQSRADVNSVMNFRFPLKTD